MTEPLLEVNLVAGYGKREVLRNVRFAMDTGERLGLVGTSGAGKTTLLLALLGLLPWRGGWARGQVRLRGENLLALNEKELRKLRGRSIALVPQSPTSALNSALSLQTHLAEAWRAHEARDPLRFKLRYEQLLSEVQLPCDASFLRRTPGQISVGQAQRFVLALALLHRPALIIADEPTSALDPITQVEILRLLEACSRGQETALLFVSHDLPAVIRLCHRLVLLHEGQIAASAEMGQLASAQIGPLRDILDTLPVPPDVLLRFAQARSIELAPP